ncbi:MAG: hypothetical protein FD153_986 [Rhodospirillaceae bacterium]|nr:MAG: hypothetical protein FD153_986 [Rhodospirillaceae bacterium]
MEGENIMAPFSTLGFFFRTDFPGMTVGMPALPEKAESRKRPVLIPQWRSVQLTVRWGIVLSCLAFFPAGGMAAVDFTPLRDAFTAVLGHGREAKHQMVLIEDVMQYIANEYV